MRTPDELDPEYRARLLELAGRRGHKGFSDLVNKAPELCFKKPPGESASLREFRELRGSIDREQEDRLRTVSSRLRGAWRATSPTPTS